jgi:hypothetical protein
MAEVHAEIEQTSNSNSVRFQVPAMNIEAVRPLVEELNKAAGVPLSRAVLAGKLSTKVNSSGFMQKIAAAKYYGFIDVEFKGKARLTERGERFAAGDLTAAQEGFAKSAFGQVAIGLAGRSVEVSTVALHLTEKAKVPDASASRYAEILLRTAREVKLVDENGFNAERLEELEESLRSNDMSTAEEDGMSVEAEPAHEQGVIWGPRHVGRKVYRGSFIANTYGHAHAPAATTEQIGLSSIPLGGGFSLTLPSNPSVTIIIDERFTSGLTKIREAIASASKDPAGDATDTSEA